MNKIKYKKMDMHFFTKNNTSIKTSNIKIFASNKIKNIIYSYNTKLTPLHTAKRLTLIHMTWRTLTKNVHDCRSSPKWVVFSEQTIDVICHANASPVQPFIEVAFYDYDNNKLKCSLSAFYVCESMRTWYAFKIDLFIFIFICPASLIRTSCFNMLFSGVGK